MSSQSFTLTEALQTYVLDHTTTPDQVLRELTEETAALGRVSGMQISAEQGRFMTMLVQISGARRFVEVGTFTGYSSLSMARGLPDGGSLLCCDVSEEWTAIARKYWERAGLSDRITLVLAPATETLAALPADDLIDMAFIDADKANYGAYYDLLLPRLRPNGVILVDNVLWSGKVVDAAADDVDTVAIRAFNDRLVADARVEVVMLPIGDGLTLARKK